MVVRKKRIGFFLLAAAAVGCTTSSTGLDLSLRGVLSLVISRVSTSTVALARVSVGDNGSFAANIELADDQFFSVNGARLTRNPLIFLGLYTVQVGAVDAPGVYTVAFNNRGAVTSMDVTPPSEFTATTPAAGANVSKNGFAVTWAPSGEADTRVELQIDGLGPDGNDDDADPDPVVKLLTNLADNGTANVGAADLSAFNPGAITLTIRRFREFNQTLGLASGTVRTEIVKETALNLQ